MTHGVATWSVAFWWVGEVTINHTVYAEFTERLLNSTSNIFVCEGLRADVKIFPVKRQVPQPVANPLLLRIHAW